VGYEITPGCQTYFAQPSWSAPDTQDPGGCVDFVSDLAQPPMKPNITEISRRLGQDLAGIVTFSYGSTRTRDIWPLLGSKGILLVVQPAPTPALNIERILALRAEAAWQALSDLRTTACSTTSCTTLDELRARLSSPATDQKWSKTGTEMSLFVIGAIADTERYQGPLLTLFTGEARRTRSFRQACSPRPPGSESPTPLATSRKPASGPAATLLGSSSRMNCSHFLAPWGSDRAPLAANRSA
jgi:hypothetical protein